jgi:uncharacterized protein (TIGR03083 family)
VEPPSPSTVPVADLAPDRARVFGALLEEWAQIDDLVRELSTDQWLAPTPCPAWDVRDQLAHIVAAEYVLAGRLGSPGTTPDAELYAGVGMFMVDVREEPPQLLLERFREITAERLAAIADLSDAQWGAQVWTPVGPGTVERLVRLRVFDCWMHEQDIRDALRRPGHENGTPVTVVLDEITAALGYLLVKPAGVPDGGVVTIELTGPAARTWHVVVDGRAWIVDQPPRPPDTTLRLPTGVFTRLCGGRVNAATALPSVQIDGDVALGRRIVAALRFTR